MGVEPLRDDARERFALLPTYCPKRGDAPHLDIEFDADIELNDGNVFEQSGPRIRDRAQSAVGATQLMRGRRFGCIRFKSGGDVAASDRLRCK